MVDGELVLTLAPFQVDIIARRWGYHDGFIFNVVKAFTGKVIVLLLFFQITTSEEFMSGSSVRASRTIICDTSPALLGGYTQKGHQWISSS